MGRGGSIVAMNRQLQTLGKRAFYLARKSAVLRRAVALPGIAGAYGGSLMRGVLDYLRQGK